MAVLAHPMRPALLVFALLATPAAAQSDLSLVDVGRAFCAAIVSGNAADLTPLLTPDLAKLIGNNDIRWHSGDAAPSACMPVGASGSVEHPESVLFLTFSDGSTLSDKLILSFINANIRIEDVAFADGTTLRESLASP